MNPGYLRTKSLSADHPAIGRLAEQGRTVVYVLLDGAVIGAVAHVIR